MKQKDREINFFKKTSLAFSGSTDKLDCGVCGIIKNNGGGSMADKKSNLTSYDRKFIATIVFVNFGLTMLVVSLFGQYYLGRYTKFKDYMKLNEKRYAILKSLLKNYDSEMKLRGLEWDYSMKEGVGAELVPNKEVNKKGK